MTRLLLRWPALWLLALLVSLWGLRLAVYLTRRNWGSDEDPRYHRWRQAAGTGFWWKSLFKVFLLQAVFLWVISLVLRAMRLRTSGV